MGNAQMAYFGATIIAEKTAKGRNGTPELPGFPKCLRHNATAAKGPQAKNTNANSPLIPNQRNATLIIFATPAGKPFRFA
jgi:hypothetical protein